MGGDALFLVSPAEDHAVAAAYADNMEAKPRIRASWEQVFLGARGELAFARFIGDACLAYCREHLLRPDATMDDYRFDLPGRIDIKTTEPANRNLVVNRVHPDVRYVLLRATRAVAQAEDPLDLKVEVMGWSPGSKARFEKFRLDPKKSFQLASNLLPLSSLMMELAKDMTKSNLSNRPMVR
jgi:hypothetical protein